MYTRRATLGALGILQTRTDDPSLSACAAGFDPVDGAPDELRTGLDRQLLFEVFPVGFNRLDAQMKALRDVARALALADQAKDFELAVGEHGQGRVPFERSATEEFLGEACPYLLAQVYLAVEQTADRDQHRVVQLLFGDIAASAGPQGTLGIQGFIVHGEHQRRCPRVV